MTSKPKADWEAIEREFRAGQFSNREIAARFGVTEGAVRKKAKAGGWERDLAERVRTEVRAKLVRIDGTQPGTQEQRAKADREIVETVALRGVEVQLSHRRDLQRLTELKRIIADRLETYLLGGVPDGPCMGDKESPGDLLEKLSRVTSRLIPLERQAHSLDDDAVRVEHTGRDGGPIKTAATFDLSKMTDAELDAYRTLAAAAGRDQQGD